MPVPAVLQSTFLFQTHREKYAVVHQTCKQALVYLQKAGFISWHEDKYQPSALGTATFV